MKDIMLDLGSTVNIFLKKYWEHMGKPKLLWSSLQLRLENQYKIYPISRMENTEVDIDGVKTIANFEVIEILEDTNPYPTLLGIEWMFDNNAILDLK